MSEPNLFDEAPSELSQDAFFCWILKWLNHPEHPMRKVGWDLLQRILEKIGVRVESPDVQALHVRRQFHNVDIVVVIEPINSPSVVVVIEDKVEALLTGADQLERNIRNVLASQQEWEPMKSISRDRIYGVLLQTGYDYDRLPPQGYVKINRDDLATWTNGIASTELERNNILRDWVDYFRRRLNQGVAIQMDNRDRNSCWSDPAYQYDLFKKLFCVTEEQIVLHRDRDGGQCIWFERRGEPPRREYFHRMTPRGRASTLYNFKFPEGYWDADLAKTRYAGACYSYYYRLDWLAGIWGIALRFWKPNKSGDDIRKMHQLSQILTPILTNHNIGTHPFRNADNANESILLLIDPGRSPGIAGLYDAHVKFVREADQRQLW
jgi:hypothetical protein